MQQRQFLILYSNLTNFLIQTEFFPLKLTHMYRKWLSLEIWKLFSFYFTLFAGGVNGFNKFAERGVWGIFFEGRWVCGARYVFYFVALSWLFYSNCIFYSFNVCADWRLLYHLLLFTYVLTLIHFINSFLTIFYFINSLFRRTIVSKHRNRNQK